MNPRNPSLNNIGWTKRRHPLEPQACCFGFPVPVLPWLDGLVWSASNNSSGMAMHHRIFNGNPWNGGIEHGEEKRRAFFHLGPPSRVADSAFATVEPACAAVGEKSAWRMGNQQIPTILKVVQRITLDMRPERCAGQKVARHGIVTHGQECVADDAAKFTSYQNPHNRPRTNIETRFQLKAIGADYSISSALVSRIKLGHGVEEEDK